MPRNILWWTLWQVSVGLALFAAAQAPSQPQVKVNVLNVCAPSPEDQKEIAAALAKVPKSAVFGNDFEVGRGMSSLEQTSDFLKTGANAKLTDAPVVATWVRIRREFAASSLFSTVQYSFSVDPKTMVETLVFRVREPKDLLQISIEDSASNVTAPATMLATNTPTSRIKLERFGKSSIVLARCSATETGPPPDQSAYGPLFESASAIASSYRGLLGVRAAVVDELARATAAPGSARRPSPAKGTARKPPAAQR